MAGNRLINILAALIFFTSAGLFVIAATGTKLPAFSTTPGSSEKMELAPAKPKPAPSRGLPGSSTSTERQLDDNWPESAFTRQDAPRPVSRPMSPENIVPTIRDFANWKIGLRYLSSNVKDVLSLFFTIIGTFFTWRSYRIQKSVQRIRVNGSED